ncbi:immunoglobulin I-set domain protein [Cooperia oncophora]
MLFLLLNFQNVLDYLPLLRRISLARNKLRFIPSLAAQNSRLISLDLRHNEIENVDVQVKAADVPCSEPTILEKEFNSILDCTATGGGENVLDYLPLLRRISLARNKLRFIPSLAAQNSRLISLDLRHNEIENVDVQVKAADVPCSEPTILEKEFNSILDCTATGGGEVHWLYNNIDLDFSSADSYQVAGNGSLLVPKGSPTHGYSCTADYGVIPRRTLRQIPSAGQKPRFTFTPKDSSYREGTAVKLHCEVIGEPRPTITWYHRRQAQFIKTQRATSCPTRIRFFSRSTPTWRMMSEGSINVGSYTCMASNIHGRIEHSARIHLVSSIPPNIYDGPAQQTVKLGQQVTFICRARGVPKPEITWFYEGSVIPHIKGRFMPIINSRKHELSNANSVLKIYPFLENDVGRPN